MTTKRKLTEQIQRIYSRFLDKENVSDVIDLRELMLLVEQAINKTLKLQVADSFAAGEIEVPRCNIIEYSCPVVADPSNGRAYINLPAIPITLPLDMGVWSICAPNNPFNPYIPIPSQDVLVFGTMSSGTNLSYLEGQVGYYVQGKKVYFNKNITTDANGSISTVIVNLLVVDFSQLGENDMLPISPEVETAVMAEVLTTLSNGRISQAEITNG